MSPRKIDAHLRTLLRHLDLQESGSVLLKYTRPTSFEPEPANCHLNTWCQLRAHGGEAVHGWVLAQDKAQMFSEAIFHTVWHSPEGKLVDVTPRPDVEKRVMFVPDTGRAIMLTEDGGRPAIDTYNNVRLHGATLVTPVEPVRVVMQSSFAERQGLWPW